MKLLTPDRYEEYEAFLQSRKEGHFLQSLAWAKVKDMWKNEILIVEDENGKIKGSMSLLIRKIPFFPLTIMYAPRGPVCDRYDAETIKELVDGARQLAKKHKSYVLKIDPDVEASDEKFCKIMKDLKFRFNKSKNFEGVQPRFVVRKDVSGLDGTDKDGNDKLIMSFESKTRYNVRVAMRKGVYAKIGTREDLAAFHEVMMVTGVRDGFLPRSLEYFEKMYDEMGDALRLYLIYYNDVLVSGAIAILYGNKVWYLYGASSNEYRNVMPNYLMQYEMMKWAVENNCDVYDFRGVSGDLNKGNQLAGLLRFKIGFINEEDQAKGGGLVEFVGALDYVFKPFMYFFIEKGERTYRELRRRIFLRKNKDFLPAAKTAEQNPVANKTETKE